MKKNTNRWVECTVDRPLTEKIDRVIKVAKDEFGRQKYPSRARFIDEAITEKLKQMEVIAK
jgi:hypothetical protein